MVFVFVMVEAEARLGVPFVDVFILGIAVDSILDNNLGIRGLILSCCYLITPREE